jgi:hypothetical protein
MFEALRIFEVREPFAEDYQVPAVDTLSDSGSGVIILPPPAPVIIDITTGGLLWETIDGATQYTVEVLSAGTLWAVLATVPAPTEVRIRWTGTEWDIEQQLAGVWTLVYRGFEPNVPGEIVGGSAVQQVIPTPDLVPVWYQPDGTTVVVGLTIAMGNLISPVGMTVTGAGVAAVNTTFDMIGLVNGRNAYLGPDVFNYSFSPALHTLYRVRAFNLAGPGPASNVVELPEPPPPPALNWSNLLWDADWFRLLSPGGLPWNPQYGETASFVPQGSASNTFTIQATVPEALGGVLAEQQGHLSYNGPAVNCNLHYTLSGSTSLDEGDDVQMVITGTGGLSSLHIELDLDVAHPGTFDFPFTIPDTGGVASTIIVDIEAGNSGNQDPWTVTLTGTLSNI